MKAYDLKPTYENIFETYKSDAIGRNIDLFRFASILNSVEDACSIAIDGNWGSGKTFFVKQVKMVMDAHNCYITSDASKDRDEIVAIRKKLLGNNAIDLDPQVCVYYDAWENDNDSDPVMSLVYTILSHVNADFSLKNTDFIKVGASIIEAFSGRNWTQMVEALRGDSPVDAIKTQKDIKKQVDDFLESLLPEKGNRLVVFIDELDRCKPSYAVRLLERIKHYFDHDRITFVFSVNTKELHHTIKKHYGDDFDGSRYLDRFFDLRVTLPPPNLEDFYRSLNFNNTYYTYDMICDAVIKTYNFELREIAKYLRLAKIAAYDVTHGNREFHFREGKTLQFCMFYLVPIMIGLRVCDAQRYSDFVQGKDHIPLIEVADKVKGFHMFHELLDSKETYETGDSQKTLVTVTDKLKAAYEAIFVTQYNGSFYQTNVGSVAFTASTKSSLLRIVGLLSKYTNTELD